MPERKLFDFCKFKKMGTLYLKNSKDFGILLDKLLSYF